jgi:glycosyltransferase involved in cell wall biosynthesis
MNTPYQPAVSLITPTLNRPEFLVQQYKNLSQQTVTHWEWIILDSSKTANPFFINQVRDTRVRYIHEPNTSVTIGEKRNSCVALAKASVIAHIDDDDFYAPTYIETYLPQVGVNSPFVKLLAWYVHCVPQNFWGFFDPTTTTVNHFEVSPKQGVLPAPPFVCDSSMVWGYGFSYWYLKSLAETYPFPPLSFGEDHHWVLNQLQPAGIPLKGLKDEAGLVLHLLHQNNSSTSFPQYFLPEWGIPQSFQGYLQPTVEVLIPQWHNNKVTI